MIPVNKFSSRGGERVRLVVLHTSEGARTVESLGSYLQNTVRDVSYHGAIDDNRYESYVNYTNVAWAVRNANKMSDNVCLCAFVAWSQAEWARHTRMLELTAAWIADRCVARGLPIRRLTDAETAVALRSPTHPGGVIDHWTYTRASGDGTHTDVGSNFPWGSVLARANQLAKRIPEDDVGFKDTYKDFAGNTISYEAQIDWTAKRVAQLASDAGNGASKRDDLGYARTQMLDALNGITDTLTTVSGDVAEIKSRLDALESK